MDHLVMNIHGQDVLFIHGKTTDVTKVSKANSMCVVQGHYHTLSKVEWWQPYGYGDDKPKRRWAMQVGCLIDNSSAAFNYNKQSPIAPIIIVVLLLTVSLRLYSWKMFCESEKGKIDVLLKILGDKFNKEQGN